MDYYIVIPAHNEEAFISLTLSLISQTHLPKKVVVVNDNSTDKTADIVLAFAKENPFITLVNKTSSAIHLPGSKVYKPSSKVLKLWTITMTSS
jgi:glycosyltransferase involved in cell wall biosynthesis